MKLVPWSHIKSWACLGCGECCKLTVQVTTKEWLNLTSLYGPGLVEQNIEGFWLRKTLDNSCPFLYRFPERRVCGLQPMKPLACKLWPFRICDTAKYGMHDESLFKYKNENLYIYGYPQCPGFSYGKPTEQFMLKTLQEFIAIRLGLMREQFYSTSRLRHSIF